MLQKKFDPVYAVNCAKFRVKIKSLAEEARIIRCETKRLRGVPGADTLRNHNVLVVRDEQRHTLLAYALLRGRPYRSVEPVSHKEVNPTKIHRILRSLAGRELDVAGWLNS